MKIKDYKLKENITINDLLKDGFNYSINCKSLSKFIRLSNDIVVWITIQLKDFLLKIEVLDDNWCQYYTPFYEYKNNEIKPFKFLEEIIKTYHIKMDNLKSFEEE